METTERMARCLYYGSKCKTTMGRGRAECDKCRASGICQCEQPSVRNTETEYGLAFFKEKPEAEYDSYYCGCFGWD